MKGRKGTGGGQQDDDTAKSFDTLLKVELGAGGRVNEYWVAQFKHTGVRYLTMADLNKHPDFPDYTVLTAHDGKRTWIRFVAKHASHGDGTPPAPLPLASVSGFLASVCTRKFYERVLKPTILDTQVEYREAMDAGRTGQATWVRTRGYLIIGKIIFSVVVTPVTAIISTLLKLARLIDLI